MVNDGVRIASDAQAWALKPAQFGGGAGAFQPDFGKLGLPSSVTARSTAPLSGGTYAEPERRVHHLTVQRSQTS